MATRDEWEAAMDAWLEQERQALGPEPDFDEWYDGWARYQAGEMDDLEAERFKRLLCAYPDVVRVLCATFP